MAYMPLPDEDEPDTTYRSQGLHTNRDSSAKMELQALDRQGAPLESSALDTALEADTSSIMDQPAPTPGMVTPDTGDAEGIGVDERAVLASGAKDPAQEHAKAVNKASASMISEVEPGQILPPVPGSGTQASYGDGLPQGSGGGGMNVNASFSYSGGEGGSGFSMDGMSMGGGGGGSGGGGMSTGAAVQLGQDIAAMDDTIDQAKEQMFQDDRVRIQMEQLAEREQGR